ncbi:MAG TPA: sulfonate ABC transporter substrate-binding protein [Candidatus Limnocylindria bacterium]|jgi:sulfonate transport system substrate-binding protein|nr:sulfonate ABC transporter substrate-binding protein [Candidatus Limnocylindria bacterium]
MRSLVRALVALIVVLAAVRVPARAVTGPAELRIGYQKDGSLLILKQQGLLAKRLAARGTTVRWIEFQAGPPLLEALNAGSIDFGATGDTPPIIAQAAGANLVYVASVPNPGRGSAILVRADAGITKLADLKGKRVAFTRGSSSHNVVVRALAKAGLSYGDIQAINLQPADAEAAFRNGDVDAWAVWDPFFALGQRLPGARVLTTAEGVAASNGFFLASRDYATRYPDVIATTVEELDRASRWTERHQSDLAQVLANATGVDLAVEKVAAARGNYGVHFISDDVVREQQSIADTFAKLGLIPHPIDVRSIVWTPKGVAVAR